jgi:muconolactone delta-isomerase
MSKFLVLWHLDMGKVGAEALKAVLAMPEYADKLIKSKKVEQRYHIVGRHGGAWIYSVDSNEELELLLAQSPVYNIAHYEVLPLAEMTDPARIARTNAP